MSQPAMSAAEMFLTALMYLETIQNAAVSFAWGATDPLWLLIFKRSFLLAPVLAFLVAFWVSLPSALSLVVRSRRLEFINNFISAWWDLFHSAFSYIAGLIRGAFNLIAYCFSLLRLGLTGLWMLAMDVVLAPFKVVRNVGRNVAAPGLPWIATMLTLAWCFLEAIIFTYVMTPLVMDTISNLSGEELYGASIRIPLFLFMLTVILGSYAVLSAWTEAIREKNVPAMIRITFVEFVAVLLEILFLYREFVDALVPWFAMHSDQNFEPGALTILGIAFMVWLGVRGMTWFLFASHGTPILMAVIQGKGLGEPVKTEVFSTQYSGYSEAYLQAIKRDTDWLHARSIEMMGALVLPPMQLVTACLNFLILLISGKNPIKLPFKDMYEMAEAAKILRPGSRKNHSGTPTPSVPQREAEVLS